MKTSRRNQQSQKGSAMVEFTLVGIALVFVLISIFEMARGMWIYHTLAHASKETTRFLVVRGNQCQAQSGCLPSAQLGALATHLREQAVGLLPNDLEFRIFHGTNQIYPSSGWASVSSIESSTAVWGAPMPTGSLITVDLRYRFRSALAMYWTGNKPIVFGSVLLGASSRDIVHF